MRQRSPKPSPDIFNAVSRNNAGRDPERLALKYAKMAQSPFSFLRGECHLFYDTLPDAPVLRDAPHAWCCGDLHFENYGSYKGDNRLVYFDINDYDEAALAPATWDIARLLTSIQCGADVLRATHAEARAVSKACLEAYRAALINGKPLWVERDTSVGLIHDLLTSLQARKRADFLDKRTLRKGRYRSLKLDGVKALPASVAETSKVTKFMKRFAARQTDPAFFKVIDLARRIAGTGSLGVERYVVLVEGKGSPDGNYLLDIKQAKPSAMAPHLARLGIRQPSWPDEASRVVATQKLMQAVSQAFLQPVQIDGQAFILRGLQPIEDRVAIGEWGRKLDRLKEVVITMGRLLAWDQLRASGHTGAASADQLMAFAQGDSWAPALLDVATEMASKTRVQWKTFTAALASRPELISGADSKSASS